MVMFAQPDVNAAPAQNPAFTREASPKVPRLTRSGSRESPPAPILAHTARTPPG